MASLMSTFNVHFGASRFVTLMVEYLPYSPSPDKQVIAFIVVVAPLCETDFSPQNIIYIRKHPIPRIKGVFHGLRVPDP